MGFLHRDLKPSNVTVGLGHETNTLRLIDLGLAKNYMGYKVGHHIPLLKVENVIGTVMYASLNCQKE